MLKVRVIPCLDVKDGRVVKGVNFVDLRDAGDPVEAAIAYDAAGADELCFLDITASHENRGIILDVVRRTAEACFMPLTVGGGVRTVDDIRALLLVGRRQGLDQHRGGPPARIRQGGGGEIRRSVHRGRDRRQEGVAARRARALGDLHPWRAQADRARCGRLRARGRRARRRRNPARPRWTATAPRAGFDIALTRAVADAVSVPVIASGGVGTLDHLVAGRTRRPRHRRPCGVDLPFRRVLDPRGQDLYGRCRPRDAPGRVSHARLACSRRARGDKGSPHG